MSQYESPEHLKAAASRGNIAAMTTLGQQMVAKPTSRKAFEDGQIFLKQAHEAGSGEAAQFIAIIHAAGLRGQQDWPKALDYLAEAALLGWEPASQQLAVFADQMDKDGTWNASQADLIALRKQIDIEALLRLPEKQILSQNPRIRKCENFLPPRFCDWMIARARPNLVRARTYDATVADGRESESRTNSSVSFGLLELDLILLLIQTRISKLTDMPVFLMENSSVLHYKVGQQFRPHHDYLDPNKPAHAADIRRFGQRLATCLVYLNDDFEGAETAFPKISQKFRCQKGGALLFANVDHQGQPDPNTLHAGLPPISGEKWLFSQWIRTGPPPQSA
ncbi:2OG-Fe(II) oxygenase [Litorimonas sp. WD9-15]|uniref:2OG-Fe(II) oxygenase n=1 Tax=Litorimonas sp. WD9-15 TaxID=3418716 RepID=UPI003CFC7300